MIRVSIAGYAYRADPGGQPESFDLRGANDCITDEQPCLRIGKIVGAEWEPLDTGWVKDPSLVIVKHSLDVRTVMPSAEEREAELRAVVEIGAGDPVVRIAGVTPGGVPAVFPKPGVLLVRTTAPKRRITVMAYPR